MPFFLLKLLNPATWKAIGIAVLSLLAGLLGLNYLRRGSQIAADKQQIKELNTKVEVTGENAQVDAKLKEHEAQIDKELTDNILDDVNKLHK